MYLTARFRELSSRLSRSISSPAGSPPRLRCYKRYAPSSTFFVGRRTECAVAYEIRVMCSRCEALAHSLARSQGGRSGKKARNAPRPVAVPPAFFSPTGQRTPAALAAAGRTRGDRVSLALRHWATNHSEKPIDRGPSDPFFVFLSTNARSARPGDETRVSSFRDDVSRGEFSSART